MQPEGQVKDFLGGIEQERRRHDAMTLVELVVLSFVWIVRSTAKPSQPKENSPLRIFDERLARGEIDSEDYAERHKILEDNL